MFRQKEKESEVCVTAKPDPLVTGAEASSQMTGSHTLPSVLSGSHTLLVMAAALRCHRAACRQVHTHRHTHLSQCVTPSVLDKLFRNGNKLLNTRVGNVTLET